MITITEPMYHSLVGIARHALKQAPALTILRDADPELFDYVVRAMPDAELFEQASGMLAGSAPAPVGPEKPADPMIPKWVAEGEAAYRVGAPRTASPGGRKDRHWLTGWDRAKDQFDSAQPAPPTMPERDIADDSEFRVVAAFDAAEPLPPARTPETVIDAEDPAQ